MIISIKSYQNVEIRILVIHSDDNFVNHQLISIKWAINYHSYEKDLTW
jgi:hypothetical protein